VKAESVATLLRHIESLSELALSYQNYNSKDSLDAVVHKLEVIGVCAGDHNMPGFQDVCFLLEDFLLETPNGSVYKSTQQHQLLSWVDVAKNYINQINDANAEKSIKYFQSRLLAYFIIRNRYQLHERNAVEVKRYSSRKS